jgi:hypothetical protein
MAAYHVPLLPVAKNARAIHQLIRRVTAQDDAVFERRLHLVMDARHGGDIHGCGRIVRLARLNSGGNCTQPQCSKRERMENKFHCRRMKPARECVNAKLQTTREKAR